MVLDEIDFNVIPMEPGTIIIKNEDKVLTACSFIQITGKAKTCKTNVLMSIIGGCFSDSIDTLGLTINKCPDDKHVIYINTEMSAFDTWKHGKLIIERLNGKPDNLHFINKMETRGEQLRKEIDEVVQTYPPYLLIIDGVVDACEDFNNQIYSKNTVDWLNRLCNKGACGCIVALHQNPEALGKESKSRGHLGTFIEQRAISTFSTTKQRDYFTLRCSRMRHGGEFEVKYIWTPEGLETLDLSTEDPYLTVIKDNPTLNRSELVKLLSTTINVSEAAISKRLKKLSDMKIIQDDKTTKTLKILSPIERLTSR